jgi:two-component system, OmpR family, sensor histidine kinase TctE
LSASTPKLPTPQKAASQQKAGSLFGEILDWMFAPLLLVWPMSLVLTWLVAQDIANRPYDRALENAVVLISQQVRLDAAGKARFTFTAQAREVLRAGDADVVYFQVLGTRGELLAGERELPLPTEDDRGPEGKVKFREDFLRSDTLRVAYMWFRPDPNAPAVLVQLAETEEKRSQLANEIIKGVMLPQFVVLPLAVLLVWLALARGIRPLNELQRRIRERKPDDLSPLDIHQAPEEVAPLVQSINELLERLQTMLRTQKRFLADAAHQMKTPLAGLRMQAELAQRALEAGEGDPAELSATLRNIARSSQRAAHVVNQLLAMSRAEGSGQVLSRSAQDLGELAEPVVRDLVPMALDKGIDLGFEPPAVPAKVLAHTVLFREMLRNLVDNALAYTPSGGRVTLRVLHDGLGDLALVQVEDSGPGVAPDERAMVFEPFYRTLGTGVDGSGLGLAIVQEIAKQHEATLTLDDAHPELRVHPQEGRTPGALFTVRMATVRG